MSLFLPEQKLGSHSSEGGSSNKFILKGRQTGAMHRGHTWVFRAETHDTMMAWYEDIKALTEKTPQERSEFVRGHSRSLSQSSRRSISSDGMVDEEDDEPFSAETMVDTGSKQDIRRPQPGGRFPSDIQVNAQRGLQAPLSPSSMSSGFDGQGQDPTKTGASNQGSDEHYLRPEPQASQNHSDPNKVGYFQNLRLSHASAVGEQVAQDGVNPYTSDPLQQDLVESEAQNLDENYLQNDTRDPVDSRPQMTRPLEDSDGTSVPLMVAALSAPDGSFRTTAAQDENATATAGGFIPHAEANSGNNGDDPSLTPQVASLAKEHRSAGAGNGSAPCHIDEDYISHGSSLQPSDTSRITHVNASSLSSQDQAPVSTQPRGDTDARPCFTTIHNRTDPTISQLHIPGEYPKGTPTAETFGNGVL